MRFPIPRHSRLTTLLGVVLGLGAGSLTAQITVDASSSLFTANSVALWNVDAPNDQHATIRSVDLVGSAALPVFIAAESNDTLFFRLRLNLPATTGSGAPGVFNQVAAIGIDLDGNGLADIAYAVTGKNGPGVGAGQSFFMSFGESLAASPNTTSWGSAYGAQNWSTSGAAADFNYSLVSSIDSAVGDVAGSIGPNTFLTFAVSYARLQDAVRALGGQYAGFVVDSSTAGNFAFSAHTGTQTNAVNVDVLAGGQVIPELPAWSFLLAGVVPLLLWQWRNWHAAASAVAGR